MDRLTNREQIFPHIYLAPIIDNTEMVEGREAGVMCGIGYVGIGNPLYPLSIRKVTEKLKNINTAQGGNPKNETLYHITDHIREGNAKVMLGRILGLTSTLNVLKAEYVTDALVFTNASVPIFGAGGLLDYQSSTVVKPLEIAVNLCPTFSITVDVEVDADGYMQFTLYNEFGEKLYQVYGHTNPAHLDDYGHTDYIGIIADERVVTIKTTGVLAATYSFTQTFASGLVTDDGLPNYVNALNVLNSCVSDADYMSAMGVQDEDTIIAMRAIADTKKIGFTYDIKASTIQDAIDFKTSLGIDGELVVAIWNRTKYRFNAGTMDIGLSGFFIGRNVKRNLSKVIGMAEYRNSGIAGVNHAIPRVLPFELAPLTDDEKTLLTKNRIITVEDFNGKIVLTDVLSTYAKNTHLMKFPTADSVAFLERKLGLMIDSQMFSNLQVAKSFVAMNGRILFENAQSNAFFDSDVENAWTLNISDENGDTVVASFEAYMEGILRKGRVQATIQKK